MAKVNRGKDFEAQMRHAFEIVPDTSIDRIPDQMNGYKGSSNICDFVAYHFPHLYYIECKCCYGNTLSIHTNNPKNKYGAISNTQWEGLLEKSFYPGIVAGYMIWFIDYDMTFFVSAQDMYNLRKAGNKSFNIRTSPQELHGAYYIIPGKKRRILFDYDLSGFLGEGYDI